MLVFHLQKFYGLGIILHPCKLSKNEKTVMKRNMCNNKLHHLFFDINWMHKYLNSQFLMIIAGSNCNNVNEKVPFKGKKA